MSAEMSTEVFGSILPLAVTALTRSRRPTCSMRTSAPACFFCRILKPAKPPPASTRMPSVKPTFIPRDMCVPR
jgi:hypothetical protein